MKNITTKINDILKKKNLSHRKLAEFLNEYDSSINAMINGKRPFTKQVKEKIIPILEVSKEEFESWILTDKYPKNVLELAIQAKKDLYNSDKLILTVKIDEILKSKNLSRTDLSKLIGYHQATLNRMIIGKESLSKSVISKTAISLEIEENTIISWVIADKYDLKALELALQEF